MTGIEARSIPHVFAQNSNATNARAKINPTAPKRSYNALAFTREDFEELRSFEM